MATNDLKQSFNVEYQELSEDDDGNKLGDVPHVQAEANHVALPILEENNMNEINIKIRKLDATEYLIPIDAQNTILDLKTQIEHDHGDGVNLQRLIFQGRELQDSDIISTCNIIDESVVHLVVRMHPPENVGAPNSVGIQNGPVINPEDVARRLRGQRGGDINTFYVYRLCRLIRSFALINGFFFLLLTFLSSQPYFLLGAVGCGFGFYGARKLNKWCLYVYMIWIAVEILFRIYIMQASNMLIWFFTLMMVVLDFYMMRSVGVVARLIPSLGAAQRTEIINLNYTNSQII